MEYVISRVFENGEEFGIQDYSGDEIRSIVDSLYDILFPDPTLPYWFEVEETECAEGWCSSLSIRCYMPMEDYGPIQVLIPTAYDFLFKNRIRIYPAQVSPTPWPLVVELVVDSL